ncbi:MAG TPA: FAD-binding oxidoreductase [Candidatus Limnocylindrales bacterium]|nr:FAD-binding oxidoreductase [Candidatus Limnocylindrales bacterium]
MTDTADAVVVGGGAMGASIAYHLAAAGAGRVVLLEREAALGTGSTGRCAGGFRIQFSSEINVRLSLASVALIRGFEAEHGLPLDLDVDGYLFLVRDDASWPGYRAAAATQRSLGARVEELDAAAAEALIPGLNVDGVVGATFGPDDGIADPSGLTNGYATLARRAGAQIRLGTAATRIWTSPDGGRVTGVSTPDGDIDAPVVVNAAGVWATALAATCGVELPIHPEPRHVVTTSGFPGRPERRTLVIDTATMFYFHREGAGVLMGMPRLADAVATFETVVDDRWVAEELLPQAVRVLPAIEDAGLARSWVGLYEMTPDRHAILGPVDGLAGLYLANGFSGHGFQHAPIVGKITAELVTGAPPTVDVSSLRLERFARGELIGESHVV